MYVLLQCNGAHYVVNSWGQWMRNMSWVYTNGSFKCNKWGINCTKHRGALALKCPFWKLFVTCSFNGPFKNDREIICIHNRFWGLTTRDNNIASAFGPALLFKQNRLHRCKRARKEHTNTHLELRQGGAEAKSLSPPINNADLSKANGCSFFRTIRDTQ